MYRLKVPFKFYLALLTLLIIAQFTKAQVPTNDAKMKSELILKLIDQIQWSSNQKEIHVGVLGDDLNFSKNFLNSSANAQKTIRLTTDLSKCDIVYVPINGMPFSSNHDFKDALVISANKSEASMYFDYEDGSMVLKTANPADVSKKGLSDNFQIIAP